MGVLIMIVYYKNAGIRPNEEFGSRNQFEELKTKLEEKFGAMTYLHRSMDDALSFTGTGGLKRVHEEGRYAIATLDIDDSQILYTNRHQDVMNWLGSICARINANCGFDVTDMVDWNAIANDIGKGELIGSKDKLSSRIASYIDKSIPDDKIAIERAVRHSVVLPSFFTCTYHNRTLIVSTSTNGINKVCKVVEYVDNHPSKDITEKYYKMRKRYIEENQRKLEERRKQKEARDKLRGM